MRSLNCRLLRLLSYLIIRGRLICEWMSYVDANSIFLVENVARNRFVVYLLRLGLNAPLIQILLNYVARQVPPYIYFIGFTIH